MKRIPVCEALDERDFLSKKITQAIQTMSFIEVKRKKDKKIGGVVDVDEFKDKTTRSYQQLQDWIKRYEAIDTAITLANAETMITTRSGKTMSRAAAIAMKKRVKDRKDFTSKLLDTMNYAYHQAVLNLKALDSKADAEADKCRDNFTSKDGKLPEDSAEMIEKLTADLYGEMIDPLKLDESIATKVAEHDALLSELEMAVKVSNATTFIEFEI